MRRFSTTVFFLLSSLFLYAQQSPYISTENRPTPWKSGEPTSTEAFLKWIYNIDDISHLPIDEEGRYVVKEHIQFGGKFSKLTLENIAFETLLIHNAEIQGLRILRCKFENLWVDYLTINRTFDIELSEIGWASFGLTGTSEWQSVNVFENKASLFHVSGYNIDEIRISEHTIDYQYRDSIYKTSLNTVLEDVDFQSGVFKQKYGRSHIWINGTGIETLYIDSVVDEDSTINSLPFNLISVLGEINKLSVVNCKSNTSLRLGGWEGLAVNKTLDISNNSLGSLSFQNFTYGDSYTSLSFNQFNGNPKFYIWTNPTSGEIEGSGSDYPYFGLLDREVQDSSRFLKLVKGYSQLYHLSKENGDIVSSNLIYSEMQDLYTRYYKFIATSRGRLQDIFRWRLNQILKFYINYGTNPAQAMVISFYILIIFSIFYFFFPSEWDITSKQLLLKQARSTLNKHEKGTFKSLLKTTGLFFLSYLNAFTLSLNAFVTLGFGTIPTKGAARYVCVVQGFLGWFLLSLFSVALINQVIF